MASESVVCWAETCRSFAVAAGAVVETAVVAGIDAEDDDVVAAAVVEGTVDVDSA